MTRDDLSITLSCDLISIVRRRYFTDRFGLKICTPEMEGGDLYDTYLKKLFVASMFNCDEIFKTK